MPKFIIESQDTGIGTTTRFTGQDARHIFKVFRKRKNDTLTITDGRGSDFLAVITHAAPDVIDIQITDSLDLNTESALDITFCSGMLKDRKMDMVIKHITQLGIKKWIPFYCERAVPLPAPKKLAKRLDRWKTISKESIKQCNRSQLPYIESPCDFKTLMAQSENHDLSIIFWEKATQSIQTSLPAPSPKKVMILAGPEGGFSENEISMAREHNIQAYGLGPRILRAETASISACTLIQHLFGDM